MNKKIIILLGLFLILCSSAFALFVFVPEEKCETNTTASLLPTLVKEKAKLVSYDFDSDEYIGVSKEGYFKQQNSIGCVVNK